MSRENTVLLLEKLAHNQLSAKEQENLNKSMSLAEQEKGLREIELSNKQILEKFPADVFVGKLEDGLKEDSKVINLVKLSSSKTLPMILAIAACLALVVFTSRSHRTNSSIEEAILLKGSMPHLAIYRQLASGHEKLTSGNLGHKGETLQVRYVAAGYRFGAIFSVDGAGKITQHFPTDGRAAAVLNQTGEISLPFAYELDSAPKFERFIFIASHKTFLLSSIYLGIDALNQQGLSETAKLDLPKDDIQYSFTLRKSP